MNIVRQATTLPMALLGRTNT